MTSRDDFEPMLAGWFEDDARGSADPVTLDRILDLTRHRTPRPALIAGIGSHAVDVSQQGSTMRWRTAAIAFVAMTVLFAAGLVAGAKILPAPVTPERLGALAYSKDGGLYVAASDGSGPVRIADGVLTLEEACFRQFTPTSIWAPDGRHLAYRDDEMTTIFVADPTGRVVASVPGYGWNVAWAPDATRIATWVEPYETLGIYRIDGTLDALLRLPAGVRVRGDYDPTWSADGRSLLIPAAGGESTSRMWEVPTDGRTPTPVRDDDPRSRRVRATSPDGARYAFVRGSRVVVEDRSGNPMDVRLPAPSVVGFPLWSPSGRTVVMAILTRDDVTFARGSDIRMVDVGNGDVTTLISRVDESVMAPIKFSSAGDRLLYSNEAADGSVSLWSIRVDGTDDRLIVDGTSCGDWQGIPPGL